MIRALALLLGLLVGCDAAERATRLPPPPADLERLEPFVREQYRTLREAAEAASSPATAGQLCRWYHAYGYGDAARGCYRELAAAEPENPTWPLLAGLLAAGDGDGEAAREALARSLALEPGLVSARVRLGELDLDEGDAGAAEERFRAALQRDPRHLRARAGLARALLDQGRDEEAAVELESARRQGSSPRLDYLLASAYVRLGRDEEAAALLAGVPTSALEAGELPLTEPRLVAVHRLRQGSTTLLQAAHRARGAGRLEEALRLYETVRRRRLDDPAADVGLAETLLAARRPDTALQVILPALERWPDDPRVLGTAGDALLATRREREAGSLFARLLALDPHSRIAHDRLARLAFAAGRWPQVVEHCAALVASDPANARARYYAARAHWHDGDAATARREVAAGLAVAPEHAALGQLAARLLAADPTAQPDALASALAKARAAFAAEPRPPRLETLALLLGRVERWQEAESLERELLGRIESAIAAGGRPLARPERVRRRLEAFAARRMPAELLAADEILR